MAVHDEFEELDEDEEEPTESSYASMQKRNFISCRSNQEAFSQHAREMVQRTEVELWDGNWFKEVDENSVCFQCERILLYRADHPDQYDDLSESRERRVQLHTLSQGTVQIDVVDLICTSCGL